MTSPHAERVKLGFELESADGSWPPVGGEWLWFESDDPFVSSRYRLVSVPLFVSGLALGDTIDAEVDETSTVTRWSAAERSANDLVWLLVDEQDLWAEIDDLCDLGCLVENYKNIHFAVSVPHEADRLEIDRILEGVVAKNGRIAFPVWQREAA